VDLDPTTDVGLDGAPDVPFAEIASTPDLHLVQALERTAAGMPEPPERLDDPATRRLRDEVTGLLDEVSVHLPDQPGRSEPPADRIERLTGVDDRVLDTARAALMAFHDRPDPTTAGAAADAVAAVRAARS
jgi:hypothetical protein